MSIRADLLARLKKRDELRDELRAIRAQPKSTTGDLSEQITTLQEGVKAQEDNIAGAQAMKDGESEAQARTALAGLRETLASLQEHAETEEATADAEAEKVVRIRRQIDGLNAQIGLAVKDMSLEDLLPRAAAAKAAAEEAAYNAVVKNVSAVAKEREETAELLSLWKKASPGKRDRLDLEQTDIFLSDAGRRAGTRVITERNARR